MISMDGFECAGHPGEADIGNWVLLALAASDPITPPENELITYTRNLYELSSQAPTQSPTQSAHHVLCAMGNRLS